MNLKRSALCLVLAVVTILGVFSPTKVEAALPGTSAQLVISCRSYWNPQGPTQRTLLNYISADSLTANGANATNVIVPPSTTGQQVNLATLFPALVLPLYIYVADVTSPNGVGFSYYFTSGASGTAKQKVGPNGFVAWVSDGATAPGTLYIDNTTTSELVLEVGIASN